MTCTLCHTHPASPGYRRCDICRLWQRVKVAQWRERKREAPRAYAETRDAIYMREYRIGLRRRTGREHDGQTT